MTHSHETYMQRCIELAKLGAGNTAPNPMVGAVLVHENRMIGEGYHRTYGQAHAEVNCINSVQQDDEPLISKSTLYVSLEPCAHHGKTPPCADLIIRKKIPRVVIGCRDPFSQVNGKGIEKLNAAGIETITGILEKECVDLNKRFFCFHTKLRPYIILKWAETANHQMANADRSRLIISNEFSNSLVHKWRSEEAAILVGTNTALFDDPSLTTRMGWENQNLIRLVIDMNLRLPGSLKIFNRDARTIIFNNSRHEVTQHITYYKLNPEGALIEDLMHALYQLNILSVLVEGGPRLLQSFIASGSWDEARIIKNENLTIAGGLNAPSLHDAGLTMRENYFSDAVHYYKHL